jgi:hypothetical protein
MHEISTYNSKSVKGLATERCRCPGGWSGRSGQRCRWRDRAAAGADEGRQRRRCRRRAGSHCGEQHRTGVWPPRRAYSPRESRRWREVPVRSRRRGRLLGILRRPAGGRLDQTLCQEKHRVGRPRTRGRRVGMMQVWTASAAATSGIPSFASLWCWPHAPGLRGSVPVGIIAGLTLRRSTRLSHPPSSWSWANLAATG